MKTIIAAATFATLTAAAGTAAAESNATDFDTYGLSQPSASVDYTATGSIRAADPVDGVQIRIIESKDDGQDTFQYYTRDANGDLKVLWEN